MLPLIVFFLLPLLSPAAAAHVEVLSPICPRVAIPVDHVSPLHGSAAAPVPYLCKVAGSLTAPFIAAPTFPAVTELRL